jgi:hypothetical protein
MTSFTKTTGVRRKGVKAGSTQGPMRTVTTVITGEAVKQKPMVADRVSQLLKKAGAAQQNYGSVQDLDKKFSRGGKVSK